MKIILGGAISQLPFSPGIAWDWMHYAVGLQRLGHEVYYVEEVRPEWCMDTQGRRCEFERSANRAFFAATMRRFGQLERSCQIYDGGEATAGLSLRALTDLAKEADLVINMSGHVTAECVLGNVKQRVYVDQDPVYTQLWHAEYGKDLNFSSHDVFFSVGLNIGTAFASVPDCGLRWHSVLPPVVLDFWPMVAGDSPGHFTTIASWSGYGDLCYRGEWYRSKHEEIQRFAELPRRIGQELEVALKSYREEDGGIRLLKENGWFLSEASQIVDLYDYQIYIAHSRGEIGITKNAYVKGRSGWFSDRSAHYLACGRPVLAQSTGFERWLPTARGKGCSHSARWSKP